MDILLALSSLDDLTAFVFSLSYNYSISSFFMIGFQDFMDISIADKFQWNLDPPGFFF